MTRSGDMIKKNEFLEEALMREQAKRELISDCETRFASWIYRFLRAHQEMLATRESNTKGLRKYLFCNTLPNFS